MIKDITFITVNYAPEDTAIGLYIWQLAEFLVTKGFNVSVITAFPYYHNRKFVYHRFLNNIFLFF